MRKTFTALAALTAALAGPAAAQDYIPVGNLVDFTGRTAVVGKEYGQAKIDAMNWINENGGINGKLLDFDTVDYSYIVPRALATNKKWKSRNNVVAIQGWGTGDTEALISFVATSSRATTSPASPAPITAMLAIAVNYATRPQLTNPVAAPT